jgi:hypothetical protein
MALATRGNDEFQHLVGPLIGTMSKGSAEIDHGQHVGDFTDWLKVVATDGDLARQCTDDQACLGVSARHQFMALFCREHSVAAAWRVLSPDLRMNSIPRPCLLNARED